MAGTAEPGVGPGAVIWDVDGVLLDSAEQHRRAWHRLAAEEHVPFTDADFWATFGMRNADIIPRIYGAERTAAEIQALADRKETYYRELLQAEATALPGARELVVALRAAGYRQAIGSSAPEENLRVIVELLGLAPYLDAVISGERVARGKPAPDIFLAAADALGTPPGRCLVIEDAPAGVVAAHAGGMRCLAVRRAGQADAPGLESADLVVDALTRVDVATVARLLEE
ncbi:MAG TPA: HAD-IA family hydrolase [Ktedonobacterales bacterium]